MRLGLLGLGRIGAFHAGILASLPGVEELVLSDPVPALAKEVAERVGAQIAESPEAVLAAGVDGMIIAAPTTFHAELTELCVEAGRPTFCEKPVAPDNHEAARLARRVAATGVPVQIGYPRRYDPAFAAVRAAVAHGDLGRVRTVRSTTLDPAPPPRAAIPGYGCASQAAWLDERQELWRTACSLDVVAERRCNGRSARHARLRTRVARVRLAMNKGASPLGGGPCVIRHGVIRHGVI